MTKDIANNPPSEVKKLSILKDDPLFWTGEPFNPQEDAFNHEAYARALYKLLSDNAPPLTIGLFGSWGIGKSTIIGILRGLLMQAEPASLRFVYFNAWKYSGDSFRRQFLIEAAKQILAGSADVDATVKRIERLNYTDVLREAPSHSLTALMKDLFSLRVAVKQSFILRVALAFLVLLIGAVVSVTTKSIGPILTALLPAVLLFLLKAKFEDVFLIQENPIFDPKLIFPEQFENTFEELLSNAKILNNQHVVVVIDDIDRCDPVVVKDILISIKTFLGNKRCFFLVPCDEDVVVEAFQASGPTQRYRDELLRKYFNVGIRIAPLMGSDLIDFANKVAQTTDIPEMVIQMAVLTNCRDARKMKQFLNTFRVKYEIAKTREQNKYFPLDVDQHVDALAKAILLEDIDPSLMDILLQNPDAFSVLERSASDSTADADLTKYGLDKWRDKYPNLQKVLRRTRDINFKDVEVFLTLKTANPETRLPRGYELKELMLAGDLGKVAEALGELKSNENKANLVAVLVDALQHSRALFLKNIIGVALEIYSVNEFLGPSDKRRLEGEIGYTLRTNRALRLLDFDSTRLLECSKEGGFLEESYNRLLEEVEAKDAAVPGVKAVSAIYKFSPNRRSLAARINTVANKWSTTEPGLQLLASLKAPDDVAEDEQIPSPNIIRGIIGSLAFDLGDGSKLNSVRRDVIVSHWHQQFANDLINKMLTGFQALQSQTSFDSNIDLLANLMVSLPDVITPAEGVAIWPHLNSWFAKTPQNPGRWNLYRAALLFVVKCPDQSVRAAALTLVKQHWNGSIKNTINPTLAFLKLHPGEYSLDIQKQLIEAQVSSARTELNAPTERTAETLELMQQNQDLLEPSTLPKVLMEGLNAGTGDTLAWWKGAIEKYSAVLDADFRSLVVEHAMAGLETASFERRKLEVFSDLLTAFYEKSSESTKYTYLSRFFELCKHSNQDVRQIALSKMKAMRDSSNAHQFKLGLNKLVGDISYSSESQVMSLKESLDKTFEFSELFTPYEWREIAHACKRLLQSTEGSQRQYALELLSRFNDLPVELEQDLVQLLINVAREPEESLSSKARQILDRVKVSDKLSDQSKTLLSDYYGSQSKPEASG